MPKPTYNELKAEIDRLTTSNTALSERVTSLSGHCEHLKQLNEKCISRFQESEIYCEAAEMELIHWKKKLLTFREEGQKRSARRAESDPSFALFRELYYSDNLGQSDTNILGDLSHIYPDALVAELPRLAFEYGCRIKIDLVPKDKKEDENESDSQLDNVSSNS